MHQKEIIKLIQEIKSNIVTHGKNVEYSVIFEEIAKILCIKDWNITNHDRGETVQKFGKLLRSLNKVINEREMLKSMLNEWQLQLISIKI